VPSFKKRPDKDNEKGWVGRVGTAIVKAARSNPTNVELVEYKWKDVREGRKDLAITMNWQGSITKKKYTAAVVVHVDVSDDKGWEVLSVDYSDDGRASSERSGKMRELIRKFNR